MSGVEWTIVTVVGVCLILLFVVLEILFPVLDARDHGRIDGEEAHDHEPAVRPASPHILR